MADCNRAWRCTKASRWAMAAVRLRPSGRLWARLATLILRTRASSSPITSGAAGSKALGSSCGVLPSCSRALRAMRSRKEASFFCASPRNSKASASFMFGPPMHLPCIRSVANNHFDQKLEIHRKALGDGLKNSESPTGQCLYALFVHFQSAFIVSQRRPKTSTLYAQLTKRVAVSLPGQLVFVQRRHHGMVSAILFDESDTYFFISGIQRGLVSLELRF